MTEQPLWATALYAGLRSGELQALHAEDVDPENGLIHVRRSWDKREGFVSTKSKAGERVVPICDHLREHLTEPKAGSYFGTGSEPFNYGKTTRRAYKGVGGRAAYPHHHECRLNEHFHALARARDTFTLSRAREGVLLESQRGRATRTLD